ncbi:hypothetical protein O6H91_01G074500 [Diphasiastrum complanatum]|uniref:Uncharacterized protein n=1 Tax=Diphasiastrum complanatum TaxID=34168 RepID=A0ACC2ES68_DIPCM|nr:hypothetical protein O6H91_01G074500 [Diphasiastrum complanatum]
MLSEAWDRAGDLSSQMRAAMELTKQTGGGSVHRHKRTIQGKQRMLTIPMQNNNGGSKDFQGWLQMDAAFKLQLMHNPAMGLFSSFERSEPDRIFLSGCSLAVQAEVRWLTP